MSRGKLVFNQIYYKIVNFQIYLTLQSPNMISVSDYDICIYTRVGVPSTYLESGDFACILNVYAIG